MVQPDGRGTMSESCPTAAESQEGATTDPDAINSDSESTIAFIFKLLGGSA
jgi:hypothetical protein